MFTDIDDPFLPPRLKWYIRLLIAEQNARKHLREISLAPAIVETEKHYQSNPYAVRADKYRLSRQAGRKQ